MKNKHRHVRPTLRAVAMAAAAWLLGSMLVGSLAGPAAAEEPAPLSRIVAGDDRRLADAETGRPFIPRGYNYVRLALQTWNPEANHHSTFEPGLYDPARADTALAANAKAGYNTVRVFLDPGDGRDNENGRPHGLGHGNDDFSTGNSGYLDNLADFVRLAAGHGIYVLPSMDVFPQNGYYRKIITDSAPPENTGGRNFSYMYEGYVKAKVAFMSNFTTEMTERLGPLMTTFLALQLDNEATFVANELPFSENTGTFVAPDGKSCQPAPGVRRESPVEPAGKSAR